MRKLTDIELSALRAVSKRGSYCPGVDSVTGEEMDLFLASLDGLVKKKRLNVEMTDVGARYHITAQGRDDAA